MHQIPKLKWFSSSLVVVFAQFVEASRCSVKNEDVVGAAPTGDAPTTSGWSTILLPSKVQLILEVWQYISHTLIALRISRVMILNLTWKHHIYIWGQGISLCARFQIPSIINFLKVAWLIYLACSLNFTRPKCKTSYNIGNFHYCFSEAQLVLYNHINLSALPIWDMDYTVW